MTEENAHPLTAGDHQDVAIVLNGIIENHAEIKQALIAEGERFCSETDAEVVAHLVRRSYAGDLVEAVRGRTRSSRGTSPSSRSTASIRTCWSARVTSAR